MGSSIWAERRIAVLGASGFLGGHVVRALARAGAKVTAMSRSDRDGGTPRGVEAQAGDVRDEAAVARAIAGADVIFMLAGRSGASASFLDPAQDLDVNANGLLTVIRCILATSSRPKIVFPGSRLEYETAGSEPVDESTPLRPNSPYGIHKVLCEQYLDLYRRQHGVRYAVARLTNPYGPASTSEWRGYNAVTHFIARALAGDEITIYGDGRQLRDYVYVDDAVDAMMRLATCDDDAAVANVGSGVGIPLVDAVGAIVTAAGSGRVAHVPWPEAAKAVETGDFVADIARIRAFGWTQKTDFTEGVRRTIATLRASTA